MIHSFGMALGAYLIICFLPREKSAWITGIWVALYLSAQNLKTFIFKYDDRSIDISWSTMVLCARLHGLGYALQDG